MIENAALLHGSERQAVVNWGQKSGPESTVIDRGLRPLIGSDRT